MGLPPFRIRTIAGLAGGLALLGASTMLTGVADAQVTATLTVSPPTITVGQSATITATGCVTEAPQEDLFVVISAGEGGNPIPTDEDGTAVFDTGPAPEDAIGEYDITATCVYDDGETVTPVFEYDPATLSVVAAAPTTTVAPTTTAPAAAEAATVTPAFTG